jgi:predicted lipid-binding transport protein (Tim44 family)
MAITRNTAAKTTNPDAHPDPITQAPESHPVGAGVGAAAGGAVGAVAAGAIAGSVFGPVGTAVGAIVGGLAGGLIGKEVAEEVNPSGERPSKVEQREQALPGTRVAREQFGSKDAKPADKSTGRSAIPATEDVAPAPVQGAPLILPPAKTEITHQMIEEAAYYIHLSGYGGSQDDNWFRAERELYGR